MTVKVIFAWLYGQEVRYLSEKVYAEKYEGLLKSLMNSEKPDEKTGSIPDL